jgi:hypothetical protein
MIDEHQRIDRYVSIRLISASYSAQMGAAGDQASGQATPNYKVSGFAKITAETRMSQLAEFPVETRTGG